MLPFDIVFLSASFRGFHLIFHMAEVMWPFISLWGFARKKILIIEWKTAERMHFKEKWNFITVSKASTRQYWTVVLIKPDIGKIRAISAVYHLRNRLMSTSESSEVSGHTTWCILAPYYRLEAVGGVRLRAEETAISTNLWEVLYTWMLCRIVCYCICSMAASVCQLLLPVESLGGVLFRSDGRRR